MKKPWFLARMVGADPAVSSGRLMFIFGCICFSSWITWGLAYSLPSIRDIPTGIATAMTIFAGLVGGTAGIGKVTEWLKQKDTPVATVTEETKSDAS